MGRRSGHRDLRHRQPLLEVRAEAQHGVVVEAGWGREPLIQFDMREDWIDHVSSRSVTRTARHDQVEHLDG